MRIIPVLDVMNGIVVHAIAGRRSEYRPIQSQLTKSTDPIEVAKVLLDATGAKELYVADLDGITTGTRSSAVPRITESLNVTCFVDAGWRSLPITHSKSCRPVLASETFPDEAFPHDKSLPEAAYSLDLVAGQLRETCGLTTRDVLDKLTLPLAAGIRTIIVLDTAHVGIGAGPGTVPLIRRIRERYPDLELISGGGIRDRDDIARLADAGVDAVLIASALHDRRLP